MSEEPIIPITEIAGWKRTDDGEHVLILAKAEGGKQFVMALSEQPFWEMVDHAVAATSLFSARRGLGLKQSRAIDTSWFELATVEESDQLVLSMHRDDGGQLSFFVNREMAKRLHDLLGQLLSGGPPPRPSDASVN